jgi:ubiquinone/menaquinone biosynthesis C-methylase UbiE
MTAATLANYYAERANEYDAIYLKPERQDDIKLLAAHLSNILAQPIVLKIACGTGYWTKFLAQESKYITATGYSEDNGRKCSGIYP